MKKILILIIVIIGLSRIAPTFLGSSNLQQATESQTTSFSESRIGQSVGNSDFKCDGRQHCTQMTSREEAVYFIRNCPNTKMDGDNDGIPCENDTRWWQPLTSIGLGFLISSRPTEKRYESYVMEELIGLDVVSISAPQDRSEFTMRVIDENRKISNIRFANDDGKQMKVDFSHVSLNIIFDPESGVASFGELEAVNRFENGFEILGAFGIIWLECTVCSPSMSLIISKQ